MWVGVYLIISWKVLIDQGYSSQIFDKLGIVFLILNPVHLMILLVSNFIDNVSDYGEIIVADLKALELTRYPQALYSALLKLQQISPNSMDKNIRLHETSNIGLFIAERMMLIKSFDEKVVEAFDPLKPLSCGVCENVLVSKSVPGPYITPIHFWSCESCQHFWFDRGSFYALTSRPLNTYFQNENNNQITLHNKIYKCPVCYVDLLLVKDKAYPGDLHLYYCKSCGGDLCSKKNLIAFTQLRQKMLN